MIFLVLLLGIALNTSFGLANNDNEVFLKDTARVIGGKEASPNSAPFIISFQKPSSTTNKFVHYCGGVLLNKNWVLTAAHCITSKSAVQKSVLIAGAHNIELDESTTQKRSMDDYKIHKLYVGNISPYDIALVFTSEEFQLNNYVKTIELPSPGSEPTGNAILYGWGSISTDDKPIYPSKLNKVELPIVDLEKCRDALGSMGSHVHETNLCTGLLTSGKGICQADSGGPLVQGKQLVGIVSWGRSPCGQKNSPSVFVKVSSFIDWIQQNI